MIVSLELLLHDNKFEGQWRKKQVIDNINIVLDEAHVVKGWGLWKKLYKAWAPLILVPMDDPVPCNGQ